MSINLKLHFFPLFTSQSHLDSLFELQFLLLLAVLSSTVHRNLVSLQKKHRKSKSFLLCLRAIPGQLDRLHDNM
jgi:hypothetical protein